MNKTKQWKKLYQTASWKILEFHRASNILYQENNGTDCNRHQLVDELKEVNCHHDVN